MTTLAPDTVSPHITAAIAELELVLNQLDIQRRELLELKAGLSVLIGDAPDVDEPAPEPEPHTPPEPTPAAKAKAGPPTRPGGREGNAPTIAWEEVALVYNKAVAEGRSPYQPLYDLARQAGLSESSARNWPKKLRQLGLVTAPVPEHAIDDKRSQMVDCPDCGTIVKRAGLGPHRTKHAREAAASTATRPAPAPIATPEAPKAVPETTDKVYRCDSCDLEFGELVDIVEHVPKVHDRSPRHMERIRVAPLNGA